MRTIPNTSYLNADPGFIKPDGRVSHEDMYDYLHLTRKGYGKFCRAIHAAVLKLLEHD